MNQWTNYGLHKKVMWYHRGVGYGNDLVESLVTSWNEHAAGDYAKFIKPLMPAE